ncbi:MAG: 4Fe-4S binding protein [Deltaproteobacteria bacterium]|nr:4Fe-4S binding protein [Deltaproteobacteria bacterium]MBW2168343.1 4Fe-4S binding protein [Deltaproteobacteria bacterium]MBW2357926.1 4Fe-4S binding protein [Deltaproteobacteria bacterium]
MDETKLYEELAGHLDQGVVGSPRSSALMEIIKILFPVEEAEIAIKLPMQNKTLPELKELFPEKGDLLEEILNRMIKRGTVFTSQRPGQERKYRLLPSVVGWAETPFWAGKDTDDTRKLSPLWLKYREEAYGQELARDGMPVMRVLPVSRTLQDSREVLSFDALKPKIEASPYRAVGHCPCRMMKRSVGEGCNHTLENCLHFGSMGKYMVEYGMAREITAEETLNILKEANQEGLVHIIDNVEGHMSTICNCCGCCCVFLDTKKKMGLHTISASSYVARVDRELCVACGTCEERCPMGAIAVNDDGVAEVNGDICIGCGVCTPTCETEAVDLVKRKGVKPPPDLSEFLAVRYKRA